MTGINGRRPRLKKPPKTTAFSGHRIGNQNPRMRGLGRTAKQQKGGCLLLLLAVASVAFAVAEALFLRSVS